MYRPVPPQVDLPAVDHEVLALWRERDVFARSLAATEGRPALGVQRGPADRQRHARHAPRRGARVQGRVPALQDDEGLPRPPQGRLGLPRAARRARRREGARLLRQEGHRGLRHRRVQRALPRLGAAPRRRVRRPDRAHGLLGRHGRRLLDDGRRTTSRACGGRSSRSSTRACSSRTTASRRTAPAAAPGCPTTSSRRATRPSSTRRSTCASPSPAARWSSGTPGSRCWSGRRRRGRWCPTPRSRSTRTSPTSSRAPAAASCCSWPRRCARPCSARTPWCSRRCPAARSWGRRTRDPSPAWTFPETDGPLHTVLAADFVTTEDGSGVVHEAPAFGAEDLALCRAYGLPVVNPLRPDGTFEPEVPLVGGVFFKKADAALVADLRAARAAVQARAVRAHLPALLALPHAARLLRAAVLVHPHHRGEGRAAPRERGHRLAPEDDPVGPVRRLAHQQHRLGALAQPLLGHAAADLALRVRAPRVHRVARRPRRPRRPGPVEPRPAPAVRRRRHLPVRRVRRDRDARARGHRRLVRQRRHAVRAVRLPAPRSGGVRRPATRRTSSARRSTRRAGGSTRSWRSARSSSTGRPTARCSASATSSTRRAAR